MRAKFIEESDFVIFLELDIISIFEILGHFF